MGREDPYSNPTRKNNFLDFFLKKSMEAKEGMKSRHLRIVLNEVYSLIPINGKKLCHLIFIILSYTLINWTLLTQTDF